VAMLGASAFGSASTSARADALLAPAAPPTSQTVVHAPLRQPVRLNRRNAQLRLVQVVFRCVLLVCVCVCVCVAASCVQAVACGRCVHARATRDAHTRALPVDTRRGGAQAWRPHAAVRRRLPVGRGGVERGRAALPGACVCVFLRGCGWARKAGPRNQHQHPHLQQHTCTATAGGASAARPLQGDAQATPRVFTCTCLHVHVHSHLPLCSRWPWSSLTSAARLRLTTRTT
jgi:hypothetical protein